MTPSPLRDLEAKLSAAKEGSRALDLDISFLDGWWREPLDDEERADVLQNCEPRWSDEVMGYSPPSFDIPHFTTSIDAALALVERVLPGWHAGFEQDGKFDGAPNLCEAWVWPFDDDFEPDWRNGDEGYRSCPNGVRGTGSTPALAMCRTICRALITKENENG